METQPADAQDSPRPLTATARYERSLAVVRELLELIGEDSTRDGLIGTCWLRPASGPVELSAHLSGVLLLEAVATIEP